MGWDQKALDQFEPEIKKLCSLPYSASFAPQKVIICRNIYSAIFAKAAPGEALAWLDKFIQAGDSIPEIYVLIALLLASCPEAFSPNTYAIINDHLEIAGEMGARGRSAKLDYELAVWAAAISSSSAFYSENIKTAFLLHKKATNKKVDGLVSHGVGMAVGLSAASNVRKAFLADTREQSVRHGTHAALQSGLAALSHAVAQSEMKEAGNLASMAGYKMQITRQIATNLPKFWNAYSNLSRQSPKRGESQQAYEAIVSKSQLSLVPGFGEIKDYTEKYLRAISRVSYKMLRDFLQQQQDVDPFSDLKLFADVAQFAGDGPRRFSQILSEAIEKFETCLAEMELQQVTTRITLIRVGMGVIAFFGLALVEPIHPIMFWIALAAAYGLLLVDFNTDTFSLPARVKMREAAKHALASMSKPEVSTVNSDSAQSTR